MDPEPAKALHQSSREIIDFRHTLELAQGELGRKVRTVRHGDFPMVERGAEPPAEAYIRLGNLADDSSCWLFWARIGLCTADFMQVLPMAERCLRQRRIASVNVVHAEAGTAKFAIATRAMDRNRTALNALDFQVPVLYCSGANDSGNHLCSARGVDMGETGCDARDTKRQDAAAAASSRFQSGVSHLNPPANGNLLNPGNLYGLIELLPMAAYAVRAHDGVIAWFNSRAAELWGRTPVPGETDERFCGASQLYRDDGTQMAHRDTSVARALETGASVHDDELVIERPDGSRVTVAVYVDPIRDEGGAIVGVLSFFHDITERKQAARTNNLLAAIVDSSDDAIVSKNLDGVIMSWNKGAERLFGYTPEEAIGQSITLLIPEDRRHEEEGILKRLARGERVDHFETVRKRKDGTALDISLTISPVKDAAGRVVGASKVARDITQRKQAQIAIKESELSARLLQLQDEERRRLARELHDGVGQLLTAMSMNAATLALEASKLSSEAARCAEDNSNLTEQVAKEIRTVSYLLHPPLLDEAGLQSAMRWYVDGFAKRSKIAATFETSEQLDRLPQDHELCLFRVAQECLANVHRHSGSPTALVRLLQTPEEVRLEVRDSGRGIEREIQQKIAAGNSVGVGLRGMRERVGRLGGHLEIESNDAGTLVAAILPVVHPKASAA